MPIWIFYDQTIMAIKTVPETVYLPNADITAYPPFYNSSLSYASGDVVKENYGAYDEVWRAVKTMVANRNPSGYSGEIGDSGWKPFRANANSGYSGFDLSIPPSDGQIIIIKDETGLASVANPITISKLGTNDRIDDKTGNYLINSGYGYVVMYNRFVNDIPPKNLWFIIGESGLFRPAS